MASSSSALRSLRALGVPCTWVPVTQWYPKILAIRTANYWSSVSFLTVSEVFDGFRQREDGFGWFLSAFDCFWYFLCGCWLFLLGKTTQKDGETILYEQSNLSMSWICWLDDDVIWSLISSALFGFSWPFLGDHGSIWMAQGFWRSREWLPGWMTFKVDGLEIVECPGCSKNLGKIWKMEKHMKTTL